MASPTLSTEQVETTLTMPDAELFLEIDGLQLNERLLRWKEARRNAPWRVCTRRQQLAMESWKETEGEDIEIRRAKMLAKILASVPIDILDFDLIVGRISTGLLAPPPPSTYAGIISRTCGKMTPTWSSHLPRRARCRPRTGRY